MKTRLTKGINGRRHTRDQGQMDEEQTCVT